jgi:uncharacterized protein YcbK (DUF882 family)
MRSARLARPLAAAGVAVALGVAIEALAQPPVHASRHVPPVAATTRPGSAAATAYMSGRQSLVGWHAASARPVARDAAGRPMLTLSTINRGESLSVPAAGDGGGFDSCDLDKLAHLLRAATGDEHPVDPRTMALVYRIQTHFDVPEIRVVSGFRVPKPGSRSNHGKGRAVDMVVPGVPDEEVARYVREMGFVGVGIYPTSQFVHVDIRPRSYFWVDFSGPACAIASAASWATSRPAATRPRSRAASSPSSPTASAPTSTRPCAPAAWPPAPRLPTTTRTRTTNAARDVSARQRCAPS